jgi:S-adenosylmethionine:tRNA ribosyltransferase-isomerase
MTATEFLQLHIFAGMNERLNPRDIAIDDFEYALPDERIAKYPLKERDQSKLLLWQAGNIQEDIFKNIGQYLPSDTLLVFNNSKVVACRLFFQKESGGIIEVFALEPHEQYADITEAMRQTGHIHYKCLIGGASKWKHGTVLKKLSHTDDGTLTLEASIVERRSDCFVVALSWYPAHLCFADVLHISGQIPIPPYLHRDAEESDKERYQTVYAAHDGSVAAPTAGLHFTPALLQMLSEQGIRQAFTTLHVGAGTFMPVKSNTMEGHHMHVEFLEASIAFLEQLKNAATIIPVGTTAMRTLESLYWMGVKVLQNPGITYPQLEMKQWEVYDTFATKEIHKEKAINALIQWLQNAEKNRIIARTQIMIAPGYQFGICNGLITNFHQPKSTLLLLIAALTGSSWKEIYRYALENNFRFLSYGDSSLLLPG